MSAPQSGPSPRPRRPCSAPRGTASGCQSAPRPTSCSGEGRGLERVHRESVMRTVQCNMPALTAHSDSVPKQAGWPRSLPPPRTASPWNCLLTPLHAPFKASFQRVQMSWICTASYAGSIAHLSVTHQLPAPELFIHHLLWNRIPYSALLVEYHDGTLFLSEIHLFLISPPLLLVTSLHTKQKTPNFSPRLVKSAHFPVHPSTGSIPQPSTRDTP